MSKDVSVVIATFNRNELVAGLLQGLAAQTLSPDRFEVIVVDDGSRIPVRPALSALSLPYALTLLEQPNQGAASARHHGVLRATGSVVVIVDDDMDPAPDLLARHLEAHARGYTLVLGHIESESEGKKPLFERMHAALLDKQWSAFRAGTERVRGIHVCTGNVSFRRSDYLAVGGFDRTLGRSEDRELGVRLERAGARLLFADEARTTHKSDVNDLEVWMRRNFLYGVYDLRIARKHAGEESADPFRFLFLINPASRVLVAATMAAPGAGAHLSRLAMRIATALDEAGAERAALAGATLSYGLDYFRGVRAEAGSLGATLRDFRAYLEKRRRHTENEERVCTSSGAVHIIHERA
jgi:glycosyltransferase involved in cell wall biosynthesis